MDRPVTNFLDRDRVGLKPYRSPATIGMSWFFSACLGFQSTLGGDNNTGCDR